MILKTLLFVVLSSLSLYFFSGLRLEPKQAQNRIQASGNTMEALYAAALEARIDQAIRYLREEMTHDRHQPAEMALALYGILGSFREYGPEDGPWIRIPLEELSRKSKTQDPSPLPNWVIASDSTHSKALHPLLAGLDKTATHPLLKKGIQVLQQYNRGECPASELALCLSEISNHQRVDGSWEKDGESFVCSGSFLIFLNSAYNCFNK